MKRVAVIGCGSIGGVHIEAYARAGAEVAAVCDVRVEVAGAMARRLGCEFYRDHETLLERVSPDGISVCTPPLYHREVAETALGRGIGVLCEKPLSTSLEDGVAMVEAAEDAGVPLVSAFCHRFYGPVRKLKGLLSEGELGEPVGFRNRFAHEFAGVERTWFADPEVAGGGIALDTCSHSLDLFRYLCGEIEAAEGLMNTGIEGMRVEDTCGLVVRSTAGAVGVIEASWRTPVSTPLLEIYGTSGTAIVNYEENSLHLRRKGEGQWRRVEAGERDRFTAQAEHFLSCLEGEREPEVTGRDGLRAVEVVIGVYR